VHQGREGSRPLSLSAMTAGAHSHAAPVDAAARTRSHASPAAVAASAHSLSLSHKAPQGSGGRWSGQGSEERKWVGREARQVGAAGRRQVSAERTPEQEPRTRSGAAGWAEGGEGGGEEYSAGMGSRVLWPADLEADAAREAREEAADATRDAWPARQSESGQTEAGGRGSERPMFGSTGGGGRSGGDAGSALVVDTHIREQLRAVEDRAAEVRKQEAMVRTHTCTARVLAGGRIRVCLRASRM